MYVCALLITYFIIMEGTVKFFNESKGFGFIKTVNQTRNTSFTFQV